ncbi:MAG: AbrB/MazE/SpoVT family DNA-binding domain-containing protein [bacterium]
MAEMTKMSSRGQIVVPLTIRKELQLESGDAFAVFAHEDTLILKKIGMPTPEEALKRLNEWGTEFAKKKGLKQKDVMKRIHKGRGVKE